MESLCKKTGTKAQAMQNLIFGIFEEYVVDKDQFPSFQEVLDEETQKFSHFGACSHKFKGAVNKVIQHLPNSDQKLLILKKHLSMHKLQMLLNEIFIHK